MKKIPLNLRILLNFLKRKDIKIHDLVTEDSDLEDVFVQLTKKN